MGKPEFVYVTYIETTPAKLWEALTSSEFSKRYWWDTSVVSDWKVGSPFSLVLNGKPTDVGEILEEANLVTTFKHGREKLHYINPVPIHQIGERWIRKFERGKLTALSELKRQLEKRDE